MDEKQRSPPSSVRPSGDEDETECKKVKSDSMKQSRLLSSRSLSPTSPSFLALFLLPCSHSVFFWNRPSVMSTEISRHSAGASAELTFPLPVIYIREEAHGGFFMPAKGGGAVTVIPVEGELEGAGLASTPGLDAVRDCNNGGTDHQTEPTCMSASGAGSVNVTINGTWAERWKSISRQEQMYWCVSACMFAHINKMCTRCAAIYIKGAACEFFQTAVFCLYLKTLMQRGQNS